MKFPTYLLNQMLRGIYLLRWRHYTRGRRNPKFTINASYNYDPRRGTHYFTRVVRDENSDIRLSERETASTGKMLPTARTQHFTFLIARRKIDQGRYFEIAIPWLFSYTHSTGNVNRYGEMCHHDQKYGFDVSFNLSQINAFWFWKPNTKYPLNLRHIGSWNMPWHLRCIGVKRDDLPVVIKTINHSLWPKPLPAEELKIEAFRQTFLFRLGVKKVRYQYRVTYLGEHYPLMINQKGDQSRASAIFIYKTPQDFETILDDYYLNLDPGMNSLTPATDVWHVLPQTPGELNV